MRKIFTIVFLACMTAVSTFAVTVSDVSGVFNGTLKVSGTPYSGKDIYVLPGVTTNTVTLVIPDFRYNGAWGDLVLTNIPMNTSGSLTITTKVYVKSRSEFATVTASTASLSASSAQWELLVTTPTLSNGIAVQLSASKVTDRNYSITNGGFEGTWSDGEVEGWHSFNTVTGSFAGFIKSTTQFSQETDKRPGSTGSYSAKIRSKVTAGAKGNGNCTNGQINAGSMTATDASGNYNFSDPSNTGYNTPFVGNPDSLVFWAKYIPANNNPTDASNKARAHAVVTTASRYQDPETGSYASVKIADAELNYSATSSMGWQRLSVPFVYTSLDPATAAYMLITFTSNMTPGGGNSTKDTPDEVYLDDAEMVYNHALTSLTMNGSIVSFSAGKASTTAMYSESDYTFAATTNAKAAKTFIAYDAQTSQVHVYVVANNYAQARAYSVYTLQMVEPPHDTEYAYSATTCDNEPYSDNLFTNLTKEGIYTVTIPNKQGGDSVVTLTLKVLPTYAQAEKASMKMDETYTWHGKQYINMTPGVHHDTLRLKTKAGCDSVFTLELTVEAISYMIQETGKACQNEETKWHNKVLPTAQTGTYVLYDSLNSVYGMDSIYELRLTVYPSYLFEEVKYVNDADFVWHGQTIKGLPHSSTPYYFYDSHTTVEGCDSLYILRLYVSDIPITYGTYEAFICDGESVLFEDKTYTEPFEGEVHVSEPNIHGGDSIVYLTVTVLPSYVIDEYLTITRGDDRSWEGWNMSTMPVGEMTLQASYYSINDCDSTIVLHLTVNYPEELSTPQQSDRRLTRKMIDNGRLYIIRDDEKIYDVLGTKIK